MGNRNSRPNQNIMCAKDRQPGPIHRDGMEAKHQSHTERIAKKRKFGEGQKR
jgi:hypothetical protein